MSMFQTAQCDYCREETIYKCRSLHPEWFKKRYSEKAGHDIKTKDYEKVWSFVNENTPRVYCLVFYDSSNRTRDPDEAYCTKHLKLMADWTEEEFYLRN